MSHSIQDLAVTCAPHQACRPLHGSDVSVCVCSNGFAYNTSDDTCYPASVDVLVDDPIIIPVPSNAIFCSVCCKIVLFVMCFNIKLMDIDTYSVGTFFIPQNQTSVK